MTGISIETTLELWASSLRSVKGRMAPLFTQERVAASAGLFLHPGNVENIILQHGIQPYVRSIISSYDTQFIQNVSTRAAGVGVFTRPRPISDIRLRRIYRLCVS
jgi:hypothetical protein